MPEDMKQEHIPKKIMLTFYTALLALGIFIYLAWGIVYGSWNVFERDNLGIYSVCVLLVGFGIVGILLYSVGMKDKQN